MTELAGVRMGSWGKALPSIGGFRPRSFVDAHCWIIGVGIRRHLPEDMGRAGRNITIMDALSEDFDELFTVTGLESLAIGERGRRT